MRICEDAGMSYEPKMGSAARSLNGSKQEQETPWGAGYFSVSAGLHIAHICVSLYTWFIVLLSFSAEVFSLIVHIQGWRVATLVLAMHHFSDHVPNRAWPAASSPYSMIPGEKIFWHHSCCWIGFHWIKCYWYQLIMPVEGESHMEQTSCRLPQLWALPILREEDLGAGEGALAPKYVHFIPYLSE